MTLRFLSAIASFALLLAPSLFAQQPGSLHGELDEDNVYNAPYGLYRIDAPVYGELGGTVNDTPTVATFRDLYGTYVMVACLPIDAEFRTELETRGRKDFLSRFFTQYVQPEYVRNFPDARAESAKYLPSIFDGSLLVMNLLPNGTAFGDRLHLPEDAPDPVAKQGAILFIKNDRIFIVTTELYERILFHGSYEKTTEDEDAILRARLMKILGKMSFPSAAASLPAPDLSIPAAAAPRVPAPLPATAK